MSRRHRYRQDALPLPGAAPREYSPATPTEQISQGWLALDGGALGPLFNHQPPTDHHSHEEHHAPADN